MNRRKNSYRKAVKFQEKSEELVYKLGESLWLRLVLEQYLRRETYFYIILVSPIYIESVRSLIPKNLQINFDYGGQNARREGNKIIKILSSRQIIKFINELDDEANFILEKIRILNYFKNN